MKNEKDAAWYESHRQKQRQHCRNWYARLTPEQKLARKEADRLRVRNRSAYQKAWREANRDRKAEAAKDWRRRDRASDPLRHLLRRLELRIKKSGVPFDLRPEDFVLPERCPVLGIPLTLVGKPNDPGLVSFDRAIPKLGYVKGNVNIISHRANVLKRDCVDAGELRAVADYIDRCASGK